ncbi:hypothetical protein KUH32_09660 [Thalassococcus sp. CAU 1522]|uniref:Uncharacterized protein n=1 Tax=Thalassococcus arenae TaxID=2851652 RepID=A0ABS6N7P5_9RHOB|nr:hypothetical protein [Thalassococcus arenae]MBV2360040.1 hypothetical protein [Thalassococcus arenae]
MRVLTTLAAAAVAMTGSQALAWGDIYMGDGTHKPSVIVHPYHAENHCPAGLQPVTVGGVICCGTPTPGAKSYYNPAGHKKVVHKVRRAAPRAMAVEGEKGVVYR